VIPGDQEAAIGATYLIVIKLALVWAIAPVRIVYLIDEADRKGFAYGTLPGHPERGEESFVLERQGAQTVIQITAFSSPAEFLVRLGQPLARVIQTATTRRYLKALKPRA
jgi:uncharacterized protein (UPF0548 family)